MSSSLPPPLSDPSSSSPDPSLLMLDLAALLNASSTALPPFQHPTMPSPVSSSSPSSSASANNSSSVLHMRLALTVTHLLLVSLGTVNLLVIFVILLRPYMRSITNVYMISLCLADFIYLTNLTLVAATQLNDKSWPFSSTLCTMYHGTETTGKYASVMFVVLLAVDRYCAMCKSNWCARYRNYRTAVLISLAAWLFAVVAASPLYYFAEVALLRLRAHPQQQLMADQQRQVHKLCIAKWPNSDVARWYITISSVLIFALPLAIIIFCYYHILNKLREALKSCKRMKRGASSRAPYHRVTRLVLWVVVFHVLSWSPFWLFNLFSSIFRLRIATQFDRIVVNIIHLFPYVNCALNPLLYVAHAENFRVAFRSLFCGKLLGRRRSELLIEDSRAVVPGSGANGFMTGGIGRGGSSVLTNGHTLSVCGVGGTGTAPTNSLQQYSPFQTHTLLRCSTGSERMLLTGPNQARAGSGTGGSTTVVCNGGSAPSLLLDCPRLTIRANSAKHSVITMDADEPSASPVVEMAPPNVENTVRKRGNSVCEQVVLCGGGVAAANAVPFVSRVINASEAMSKKSSLESASLLLQEINAAEQMPTEELKPKSGRCMYTMGMAAGTVGAVLGHSQEKNAEDEEEGEDEFV